MLITRQSPISGITRSLELPVTAVQLAAWHAGTYIQDAMPELEPEEREFLMTGITAEEWEDLSDI